MSHALGGQTRGDRLLARLSSQLEPSHLLREEVRTMKQAMRAVTAVILAAALYAGIASATTVFVMSIGNNKVQVLIDGTAVRTLMEGDTTPEGVTLKRIEPGAAVLEFAGRTVTAALGQTAATHAQAVLKADPRGHYYVTAYLNGTPVNALIDTGATHVAMNSAQARQLGIDYRRGQQGTAQTANGPVTAYLVNLSRVQVGDIVLGNVAAQVTEGGRAQLPYVLIGMSFLKHVEMQRSGGTMVLQRAQ